MNSPNHLAKYLLHRLSLQGVKRIFVVPGGGSSLALIEATASADIEFVLARTETAATVMHTLVNLCPHQARLCVDAGVHMFSAMQLWPAQTCYDALKSNGLSTMGFALPTAIAVSLREPDTTTIALTGDGGLLMCLAELSTAVARRCRIVVLVINDAALSLIDIKQQQQASKGVRYRAVDFAATARALGCTAWQVKQGDDLSAVLKTALACDGPALVDIRVDASGYMKQLSTLRG